MLLQRIRCVQPLLSTKHLLQRLQEGMGPHTIPFQTPDLHPGDIHAGQILVAATMMTEVEVVVADDRQPGETRTTIQVWAIIRKQIERGIALPLVALLHQLDTTGASLTCLAGTQIPNAYECSVNASQKRAITCLEEKFMKRFGTPLTMFSDAHLLPQECTRISKPLRQAHQCPRTAGKTI
jgi:hypothetical protein